MFDFFHVGVLSHIYAFMWEILKHQLTPLQWIPLAYQSYLLKHFYKTQDKLSGSANTCIASLSQVCLVINVCKINIEGEKAKKLASVSTIWLEMLLAGYEILIWSIAIKLKWSLYIAHSLNWTPKPSRGGGRRAKQCFSAQNSQMLDALIWEGRGVHMSLF